MTTHILSRNLFDELLAQGVVRWDEEEAQYLKVSTSPTIWFDQVADRTVTILAGDWVAAAPQILLTDQQRQWVEDWQVHIRIVEKLFGEGRPVEIVRRSSYDLL